MNTVLRNTPNLEELDKKYLFHPFTALAEHEKNGPTVEELVKGSFDISGPPLFPV